MSVTPPYARSMSAQTPAGGPLVEGPADPEHDPRAAYALEPDYVDEPDPPDRRLERPDRRRSRRRSTARRSRTSRSRTPVDVAEAFSKARKAQQAWSKVSIDERAQCLLRLHDLVLDRQDEIIDLIVWESGKARKHAFDEPLHIALTARYYAPHRARAPRHRAQARRRTRPHPGRGQPGAQGRRRHHLALELPVHDGALRRAARAARRQRGGRQAGRADHAVRAARARSCSRRPASRRTSGRSSPAPARTSARRSSAAPTTSASPARRPPARSSPRAARRS